MNIIITGHHVEVTQAIRDYVNTKLERIMRHFNNVTGVTVILSVDKLIHKAEATMHVKGKDIHVECEDGDMYAAIDEMMDKLDRQVLKHKDKMRGHHHDAIKHHELVEALTVVQAGDEDQDPSAPV